MSNNQRVEKREKTMTEIVVVVVLLSLLMASFIATFMEQEEEISKTGFEALANNFFSQITIVHGQWFMDKKPTRVMLATRASGTKNNLTKEAIPVNKQGWIDVEDSALACHQIWQHALNTPMVFMKSPVSAVEIKKNIGQQKGRVCRYSLNARIYFEYYSFTGRIVI